MIRSPGWFERRKQLFEPWYTGRVHVRIVPEVLEVLVDEFADDHQVSLRDLANALDPVPAKELNDALDELGDPDSFRLIRSFTVGEVEAIQDEIGYENEEMDLNAFFGIEIDVEGASGIDSDLEAAPRIASDQERLEAIRAGARRMGAVSGIGSAYIEPVVVGTSPPVPVSPDVRTPEQGYLYGAHAPGSNRSGVNVDAVWEYYDGSGVRLVPLDVGWQFDHEDLPNIPGVGGTGLLHPDMSNPPTVARSHGTKTLGIIAAVDQADTGTGVVGISSGVAIPGCVTGERVSTSDWLIADALCVALNELMAHPGSVFVVEVAPRLADVQLASLPMGVPLEAIQAWRAELLAMHTAGIIVVESAGNPTEPKSDHDAPKSYDLDEVSWSESGLTLSFDPGADSPVDSGAIIVGACESVPDNQGRHPRLKEAWFGGRIDCYAWGENALTTECWSQGADQCVDGVTADVYSTYDYTSAATAIIAGTVVVIQEMYTAVNGVPATPDQMRAIVRNKDLGTRISDIDGDDRVMPDLRLIAERLGALPDPFVRDSPTDSGQVPSPTVSMSPDVFVRQNSAPPPNAADHNTWVPNDLVVPDQSNFVFVRIGNRSRSAKAIARGVRTRLFWAEASTLILPQYWSLIGELYVPGPIAKDQWVLAGPYDWTPTVAEAPASGHGCFIVLVSHPHDPEPTIPSTMTMAEYVDFIGSSNNVAWRNFNVLQPTPDGGGVAPNPAGAWNGVPFFMRGAPEEEAYFDIEIATEDIRADARVFLRGPMDFISGLAESLHGEVLEAGRGQGVLVLEAESGARMSRVRFPRASEVRLEIAAFAEERFSGKIAVIQSILGLEVGRVTVEVPEAE